MIILDIIIRFFRDVLDGPLYIILVVICLFLIIICIGNLLQNKKGKKQSDLSNNESLNKKMDYTTGVDYTNTIIQDDSNNYSDNVYSKNQK